MTKIYIVYGDTGEYSDQTRWEVAAYRSREMAEEHARLATAFYRDHDCLAKRHARDRPDNPYDPNMSIDYTGTTWDVYELELRDSLPSVANQP